MSDASNNPQDSPAFRLPIWAIIRDAVLAIAREWKTLLRMIAFPALAVVAINVVVASQLDQEDPVGLFQEHPLGASLAMVLSTGFGTMIAVSCHRLVILGVDSLPSAWGVFWSSRETRFLGWAALIYGSFMGGMLLVGRLASSLGAEGVLIALSLMFFVLFPLAMYVLPRLSLVFPATAVGQRPSLRGSWRRSRSNGWRLVLVMFISSLPIWPLSLVGALLPGIAPQLLSALTVVFVGLIGIASLSKVFCSLPADSEAEIG